MKIQSLQLNNFKCYEDKLFLFDDHVKIIGKNGSGKSSIRESILFALYNKTDATVKDTDKYIRNGTGFAEVILKTDKGEVKRQRNSRKSEVWLDGAKTTQQNIEDKLSLPSFEVFNSVFTAGYFMTLEEKEQRQIILDLLPSIDREKIFEQLGGQLCDVEGLDDLDTLYKETNANKSLVSGEIESIDRKIKDLIDVIDYINVQDKCPTCLRELVSKAQEKAVNSCRKQVAELKSEKEKMEPIFTKLKKTLDIIKKLPQEEIKSKMHDLEPLLAMTIPDAQLVLMEVLKTEMGYKPVFKLLVNGKEYKYLSTGEKKKIDVGLCELVNIFHKVGIVFIDNLESVSDALITNFKQIFTSRVTQDELSVTTTK